MKYLLLIKLRYLTSRRISLVKSSQRRLTSTKKSGREWSSIDTEDYGDTIWEFAAVVNMRGVSLTSKTSTFSMPMPQDDLTLKENFGEFFFQLFANLWQPVQF